MSDCQNLLCVVVRTLPNVIVFLWTLSFLRVWTHRTTEVLEVTSSACHAFMHCYTPLTLPKPYRSSCYTPLTLLLLVF